MADRVTYKLGVTVYKYLHGQAPDYLSELFTPVAQVAERQHLHSASRRLVLVPRFQLDTYGRRTFAVAGPMTWNLFQNNLHEPDMQIDCFRRTLKTFLFLTVLGTLSTLLEALFFALMRYINRHLCLHLRCCDNSLQEFTMAEIQYQVDEMLFKMNALSGLSNLPEKPPMYFTDSDTACGGGFTGADDGLSSGGSEVSLSLYWNSGKN